MEEAIYVLQIVSQNRDNNKYNLDFSNPIELHIKDFTNGDLPSEITIPPNAIVREVWSKAPVEEIVYDIRQIAIQKGRPINKLIIYSHAASNLVWFFGAMLKNETIDQYKSSFELLRDVLGDSSGGLAHILLFSCQLAKSLDGKNLVYKLSQFTNSCVHASTDYVGVDGITTTYNPFFQIYLSW